MAASPTQRTLERLRRDGYRAAVVEKYVPQVRRRQDLFGIIDVLAVHPHGLRTLGVQATTVSNQAARLKKLIHAGAARDWLLAGNRLEVWGWARKLARPGGKRRLWQVTRTPIELADLAEELAP